MRRILVAVMMMMGLLASAQSTSYIVSDFAEEDLPAMLELCEKAAVGQLLQRNAFATLGHYEWNPVFAPKGDESVERMVNDSRSHGVQLGVFTYQDAISFNDRYFSPPYYPYLLRQGQVTLFDDILAEQRDFALRASEALEVPSTLNLLLVDDEMISYSTMEPVRELLLLHRCERGAYGTKPTNHAFTAEAYKIWDSPQRFVAPDEYLQDSVRQHLTDRITASGMPFVMYGGSPGQTVLEESVRVRQVERWEQDEALIKENGLGWFVIRPADKKRACTTPEEVEWMLSKVAGYHTGCGWVIEKNTLLDYGGLEAVVEKMGQWERLRRFGVCTETQTRLLRDPYLDWHLEPVDDTTFQLYPLHFSRRHRCTFLETDTGLFTSEPMEWRTEQEGPLGLRIQVDGQRAITNPMILTELGSILFPCVILPGQRLVFDFEGAAKIVDANYHTLVEVVPVGQPILPEGPSMVSLSMEMEAEGPQPVVSVRYLTRETPETISLHYPH